MNTSLLFIGGLGTTELLIVGAIIVMMFGASKLPELARGTGQALRIFKSETKGLIDDDKAGAETSSEAGREHVEVTPPTAQAVVEPEPVIATKPRSSTD